MEAPKHSLLLFMAVDGDLLDKEREEDEPTEAVLYYNGEDGEETVCVDRAIAFPSRRPEGRISGTKKKAFAVPDLVVPLNALRDALLSPPESQLALLRAGMRGDWAAARAALDASGELRLRMPSFGMSLFAVAAECGVADVRLGPGCIIVKLRHGEPRLVRGAAAEVKAFPFLGTLVACATQLAVEESVGRGTVPRPLCCRLFCSHASTNTAGLAHMADFTAPVPQAPLWIAVYESDDRHYKPWDRAGQGGEYLHTVAARGGVRARRALQVPVSVWGWWGRRAPETLCAGLGVCALVVWGL